MRFVSLTLIMTLAATPTLQAQESADAPVELPPFPVVGVPVAVDDPAATFAQPVSLLRYAPLVDVQTRNFAEAQADVAIRGSTFEATAFRVGPLSLHDPQTGHYTAEIPIPAAMLSVPVVATDLAHAAGAFNATSGSLQYAFAPLPETSGAQVRVGYGEPALDLQELTGRHVWATGAGETVGVEAHLARSSGDGTVPFGDHDFERAAARLQWRGPDHQTDLFAGYQAKFFGWPNLYTPFGVNETENLQTTLLLAQHALRYGDDNRLTLGSYYRKHRDHYVFSRENPTAFQAFHESRVVAAGWSGEHHALGARWRHAGQWTSDQLDSSNLTFGPFSQRDYLRLSLVPTWSFATGTHDDRVTVAAGLAWDDSDRDDDAWSPLASIAWESDVTRVSLAWSGATQLPGYTALNANANAGLFRGNPDLGRETSDTVTLEVVRALPVGQLQVTLFHRTDDDLVDWTYAFDSTSARAANAVDLDNWGFAALWQGSAGNLRWAASYEWLDKEADYGDATVDASFYALNYAEHRATLALAWALPGDFELRADHEWRRQAPNALRTEGEEAFLASYAVAWTPDAVVGATVQLLVDNAFNTNFEEVPGTPGAGRQWLLTAGWEW